MWVNGDNENEVPSNWILILDLERQELSNGLLQVTYNLS
jgi:hypothetical protein